MCVCVAFLFKALTCLMSHYLWARSCVCVLLGGILKQTSFIRRKVRHRWFGKHQEIHFQMHSNLGGQEKCYNMFVCRIPNFFLALHLFYSAFSNLFNTLTPYNSLMRRH